MLLLFLARDSYENALDAASVVITTGNILVEALQQGIINFPDISLAILAPGGEYRALLDRYRCQRRIWKENIQVIGITDVKLNGELYYSHIHSVWNHINCLEAYMGSYMISRLHKSMNLVSKP